MNWFGLYPILLGILCLFFPGLIVFGYGAKGFDWFVVIFLTSICLYLVLMGVGILLE